MKGSQKPLNLLAGPMLHRFYRMAAIRLQAGKAR